MVTIGMNYDVLEGKNNEFETVFYKVLDLMDEMDGHSKTNLFRDVRNGQTYLIMSEWTDEAAFNAFISSDQFKKVADWGKSQILAGRPHHEVYGGGSKAKASAPTGGGCPVAH